MNDQPNENFELTWQELDLATELLLSAYKAIPDSVINYKDDAYHLFQKFVREMVRRECEFHSVRHGIWRGQRQTIKDGISTKIYRCELCGREVEISADDDLLEKFPYCHCGAKMLIWE